MFCFLLDLVLGILHSARKCQYLIISVKFSLYQLHPITLTWMGVWSKIEKLVFPPNIFFWITAVILRNVYVDADCKIAICLNEILYYFLLTKTKKNYVYKLERVFILGQIRIMTLPSCRRTLQNWCLRIIYLKKSNQLKYNI